MNDSDLVTNQVVPIRELGHDEEWLEGQIKKDPSMLGLGQLKVKGEQVIQPNAGRMDLLLSDPREIYFYETELMLGKLDASHIVRAIEYWDLAKRFFRDPDIEHTAVIIAEDITSRFFNVLALLAKLVPIIALQVSALKVGPYHTLSFTKVLDLVGADSEDVEVSAPKGRDDWPQGSLGVFDSCFELVREVVPSAQPNYKQNFIGVTLNGQSNNFVNFGPRRTFVRTKAYVNDREAWIEKLQQAGFEVSSGGEFDSSVRFRIEMADVSTHSTLLKELFSVAYENRRL